MSGPDSYEEWKAWAQSEDERSGMDVWKREDRTRLYDFAVIRRRYDELSEIRRVGDLRRLVFYLNEGVHGNMGGMGSPRLYGRALFGTKALVSEYIAELVDELKYQKGIEVSKREAGSKSFGCRTVPKRPPKPLKVIGPCTI